MKMITLIAVLAVILNIVLLFCFTKQKKEIKKLQVEHENSHEELKKNLSAEYAARMVDKQAKLSALQSQINPHFLYNTLECIRSEALLYSCDSIARMAKALASFFRYSISKKENIVTLQEELKNIENYFLIQSYRFDDKFSFQIKIADEDERVYSCLIPKLSLQPIVENAIFHGLETKAEPGKIIIRVETTENNLILVISDDGVGIDARQLEKMREDLYHKKNEEVSIHEKGNGIALNNVSQRIKLVFGNVYGIQVYSTKGIGTDVEIILPIITDRDQL